MRTIGGQFLLVLVAPCWYFPFFFYYSKKTDFLQQPEFIFLYGLFLATIMLGSLGYHQSINMFAVPVLFFIIIVNILIGSRSALLSSAEQYAADFLLCPPTVTCSLSCRSQPAL